MKFNIKLNTIKDVEDFTDYANNVNGEIYLRQGRYVVSGKSVMGILSLSLLDELNKTLTGLPIEIFKFAIQCLFIHNYGNPKLKIRKSIW